MKRVLLTLVLLEFLVSPVISFAVHTIPGGQQACDLICASLPESPNCRECSHRGGGTGGGGQQVAPTVDVLAVLNRIVDWLFTALLIFAAIMIVVAAYMFVTAAGNPEQVAKARTFVIYALVGVAIAIAARGLVALVRIIVG